MLGNTALLADTEKQSIPLALELEFAGVSKSFASVLACDSIDLKIKGGGIHALVGENGAGKSTLTKMLAGFYQPTSGSLYLSGKEVVFNSAADARKHGIGMVHQQLALVPSFTGYENVLLGDERLSFALNKKVLEKKVAAKASELGFNLNLALPVSAMSIADRQKLEIFKLLWRDAKVLILDEPTSQLAPLEAEEILRLASDLAATGRIVILITHHLNEVISFARSISVLRKGQLVANVVADELSREELAGRMLEFDQTLPVKSQYVQSDISLLKLVDINTEATPGRRSLKEINLELKAGEVVGVAGVTGAGQIELAEIVAGLLKPESGKFYFENEDLKTLKKVSVGYVPSEQKQACAFELSLASNCFLKAVDGSGSFGFLNQSLLKKQAREIISYFKVTPALPEVSGQALSGGNLQRLIIGRELKSEAKIIVADNPSAGLDAFTSKRVRQEFAAFAKEGKTVLFISPDVDELITVCDRILVMFKGKIVGEQRAGEYDSQALALLMGGVENNSCLKMKVGNA
ncbi:MAG: ATP-binding cassette domain-containing protein [Candidatus Obscuribacterales bacterium]|nr:ATP-binding cassette domain-containing protein [Candidatus Obscuribacterales bacterium]